MRDVSQGSKPARMTGFNARLAVVVSVVAVVGIALLVFYAIPPSQQSAQVCQGGTCGFEWGNPVNATGSGNPECPGHYCYVVAVAQPGGGNDSLANLHLSLHTPSGAVIQWPGGTTGSGIDSVLLVHSMGSEPCATYDEFTGTWFWNASFSGSLSAGYSVLIHTGGVGALYGLRGDSLVESGFGGTPGTVDSAPFP